MDITTMLTHLFLGRHMVCELNHTFKTLVPKIPVAKRMDEFRPISVFNTLYKIHANLIADRMAIVILDLISKSQTAFTIVA